MGTQRELRINFCFLTDSMFDKYRNGFTRDEMF